MLLLYRAGPQAEALAAAERVRSILVHDLGLEPGPSLQRLELDILNHEPRLDGPIVSSTDDQPEPPEMVANLRPRPRPVPRTATSYVEPDDVHLADVATSAPMVTLAGPPGVGKSRLAARLVSGLVDRNVDIEASAPAHWLDLADGSLPGRSDEMLLLDDDDKALLVTMAVYEGTVSTQQIIDGSGGGTAAAVASFAEAATVTAYNSTAGVVDTAAMASGQSTERLQLSGADITTIVVESLQNETLILEICIRS